MGFAWFLVGTIFGMITYRWFGVQIEEFLDWAFSGKGDE